MLNRRDALRLLGAGFAGAVRAAGQPFNFTSLDHVEFTVKDVEKSRDFYARLFGHAVLKNKRTARRYLKLGPCYIAIDQSNEPRVDHFSAGVEGFDVAKTHEYLSQQGVAYRDFPSGRDLNVTDADGIRLQLSAANGWDDLAKNTAAPESVSIGEPFFRPTGLDHILLNVSDPEKSAEFYSKVLGPISQRNNNRIWFQVGKSRIGLLKTPAGERTGVSHYCVSVERFDYADAVKRLEAAGVKVDTPEVAGAPDIRDPDGYRVQVIASR